MRFDREQDILVVGAGPAGMAAACSAADGSGRVTMVDDNPAPGGQIWREGPRGAVPRAADVWRRRVRESGVTVLSGVQVVGCPEPGLLLGESAGGTWRLRYRSLIIATGAQEVFLPFPGWTLPGVTGAGGLQALVKGGLSVEGARVVVAGTGPLLLAVADFLKKHRADVRLVAEQAPRGRVAAFGSRLLRHPRKLCQAVAIKARLRGVPYRTGCWPVAAEGKSRLASVRFRQGRGHFDVPCDLLACGFGLTPRTELASALGCRIEDCRVQVDKWQTTTVQNVHCAGEPTGVGGLNLALVEGRIAGHAASGRQGRARAWFRKRDSWRKFALTVRRNFALRDELRSLPAPDTVVCRCEDVAYADLVGHASTREAKLQTRAGMGPCQGRVCGSATRFLFSWSPDTVRPPVFPARIEALATVKENP